MGRSSSKQGRGVKGGTGSMEIDNVDKVKEEPHLSGAYIRSLVKQLTSSRTKDSAVDVEGGDGVRKNKTGGENLGDHSQESQEQPMVQPPQHKKQVRRRLHTSRPYQERLLNMAEARREIVTALKFHRASMKQQEANNQDHQLPPVAQPSLSQEAKSKSRRNPRVYASTTTTAASVAASGTATNFSGNYLESYSSFACPPPMPYYWPVSAVAAPPPPLILDNFNLTLPNQPLGLTLNYHDFSNIDATLFHNPLSIYTSSSSSSPSASSPTLSVATDEMVAAMSEEAAAAYSSGGSTTMNGGNSLGGADFGGGMHHAMDTEEMQELRSISEQHQMEWSDTLNMVTSARWVKFLKTMEIGGGEEKGGHEEDEDGYYNPFDQVIEFPPWLVNGNENCCLQDDHFSEDYLQDPALPCMDIGEIDGMDGEWLA